MARSGTDTARLLRDAGAVLQAGFDGTAAPEWLRRRIAAGELGGIALFSRNVRDIEQLAALTALLRQDEPQLLVAIDEEGGDVTRLEVAHGSSYPGNAALGSADDPRLTEQVAFAIGRDLAAAGVNLNYAPVADVNANAANPVIGVRSFGSGSALVVRHTAAYVRGLQAAGVAACAKHFPGHGDAGEDSHLGLPLADFDDAKFALHLAPFRAAVAAGTKTIMTAHILFPRYDPDLPATMSHAVLTGLLRGELGYDGLIITDGIDMGSISAYYGIAEGTVKAIAAGADAICFGGGLADENAFLHLRNALVWAVRERRLSEERLHEAAERNRAVAGWSAEVRAGGAGASEADRGVGLEAARRAVRVRGELKPLSAPVYVAEFSPLVSIAVDTSTQWGLIRPVSELLPGTNGTRVMPPISGTESVGLMTVPVVDHDARVDTAPILAESAGRALVLAVRDLHLNRWMARAVDAIVAERPDAVVVEFGLPYGRTDELVDRGVTVVATYGAAWVCGIAAAEALTGRRMDG
ncbi:MAG TPA: glycoside hydrolase family 3 protein [Actinocrinis sp.]|uniref:glycoside hydrolase family 3 protein n=1 Tax=Actinocrinis sp. TaxID=1920516 RepID=UPI002DDD6FC9|nr:glycoside hydrolase family 3 protein [Actinocrinis sp.]HEV2343812.1 glycoside hydrolase family 3 protein [Actinocrinis sp.]